MPTALVMSKRKLDGNAGEDAAGSSAKQPRSRSAEPPSETEEPEKREVLKRLFGRYCAVNIQGNNARAAEESEGSEAEYDELDENEDPLLDEVPVNMDPEQLGFLVCAQETLRFLHGRGFTAENPMFVRLRSRLLQGIHDIAAA